MSAIVWRSRKIWTKTWFSRWCINYDADSNQESHESTVCQFINTLSSSAYDQSGERVLRSNAAAEDGARATTMGKKISSTLIIFGTCSLVIYAAQLHSQLTKWVSAEAWILKVGLWLEICGKRKKWKEVCTFFIMSYLEHLDNVKEPTSKINDSLFIASFFIVWILLSLYVCNLHKSLGKLKKVYFQCCCHVYDRQWCLVAALWRKSFKTFFFNIYIVSEGLWNGIDGAVVVTYPSILCVSGFKPTRYVK